MALWGCLGQAANVAQLGGVDIPGLIGMIVQAAKTASRNDEECWQLARRAGMIDELLRRLQGSEMADHLETWKPLEGLNETLRQAYELVSSCQGSSYAYRFCMGCELADRFRAVQKELDYYVGSLQLLFPIIIHEDLTRHMKETKAMRNGATQDGAQVPAGSSASHSNRNASNDRVTVTGDLEKDNLVAERSELTKRLLPDLPNMVEEVSTENQRSRLCCWLPWKDTTIARNIDIVIGDEGTGLTKFTFSQLADATNNFSLENQIGLGGFSIVYKGQLHDGLQVAVKRAAFGWESSYQFENEIKLTPKLRHANIVKLLGYCIQKREKILVFEYMPNRSLDSFIYGSEKTGVPLDWSERRRIVEGIAQGAVYLHKLCGPCIIHGDLKPGNILLDSDMNPKICDFGISHALKPGVDVYCTSTVMGSRGFVAPEYAERGCFSVKSDMYSFGATLLQIISGKRRPPLSDQSRDYGPLNSWAWDLWKKRRMMEILDPLLRGEPRKVEMMRWVQIALLCVQQHPKDRPSMWDVLMMLSCENVLLQEPNQPAYYKADTTNASSSSS